MSAATITVSELKAQFGTYIKTNQQTILKLLTQRTFSQQFMTTIASKDLEWRMAKAVIDDVVQGFQKDWTPKGNATFTPIAIPQRRHKVDIEFYPDEVFESWLGFLTDEKKNRKDWPITRYIIEQLLIPKVNENRELKLIGVGDYEAIVAETAQATGKSMDGFCTILEDKYAAGTSNINFFDPSEHGLSAPSTTNIVDFMEAFVDWISEIYQSMNMPIFNSNTWYKRYKRRYRALYGSDADFTRDNADEIDYSNNRLQPLPSMAGKNIFFCTPKENFIRLKNANDGASNIEVESVDRKIKVFADWHESVGYGIEEAIFAYVPEDSGSGS